MFLRKQQISSKITQRSKPAAYPKEPFGGCPIEKAKENLQPGPQGKKKWAQLSHKKPSQAIPSSQNNFQKQPFQTSKQTHHTNTYPPTPPKNYTYPPTQPPKNSKNFIPAPPGCSPCSPPSALGRTPCAALSPPPGASARCHAPGLRERRGEASFGQRKRLPKEPGKECFGVWWVVSYILGGLWHCGSVILGRFGGLA